MVSNYSYMEAFFLATYVGGLLGWYLWNDLKDIIDTEKLTDRVQEWKRTRLYQWFHRKIFTRDKSKEESSAFERQKPEESSKTSEDQKESKNMLKIPNSDRARIIGSGHKSLADIDEEPGEERPDQDSSRRKDKTSNEFEVVSPERQKPEESSKTSEDQKETKNKLKIPNSDRARIIGSGHKWLTDTDEEPEEERSDQDSSRRKDKTSNEFEGVSPERQKPEKPSKNSEDVYDSTNVPKTSNRYPIYERPENTSSDGNCFCQKDHTTDDPKSESLEREPSGSSSEISKMDENYEKQGRIPDENSFGLDSPTEEQRMDKDKEMVVQPEQPDDDSCEVCQQTIVIREVRTVSIKGTLEPCLNRTQNKDGDKKDEDSGK